MIIFCMQEVGWSRESYCIRPQFTDTVFPGKKVLLDYYYNNEWRVDSLGAKSRWHYTWEDESNGGYSELGKLFMDSGCTISHLEIAPSRLALQHAAVYIIADPDTEKETADPNYIGQSDIEAVSSWVKQGGVLVLLGNDKGNAEFEHFNMLAGRFGIHFNEDKQNTVADDQFEQGVVMTAAGSDVFGHDPKKLFVKEFSSLKLSPPAKAVLVKDAVNVMALSGFGKGWVVALGDPWIYNEYISGRRLPSGFQNNEAANEWVRWLLKLSGSNVIIKQ